MTGIKPFAMGIAAMVAMGAVALAQTDDRKSNASAAAARAADAEAAEVRNDAKERPLRQAGR